MRPRTSPAPLALLLLFPAIAFCGSIYVDDNPASENLGTFAHPYTSIQTALNAAGPGDTIWVMSGRYNEKLQWSNCSICVCSIPGEGSSGRDAGETCAI